jgi:hypothetical protein
LAADGNYLALAENTASGETRTLRQGETICGLEVAHVALDGLWLRAEGGRKTLVNVGCLLTGLPASGGSAAAPVAASATKAAPGKAAASILERLRRRRFQETGGGQ